MFLKENHLLKPGFGRCDLVFSFPGELLLFFEMETEVRWTQRRLCLSGQQQCAQPKRNLK